MKHYFASIPLLFLAVSSAGAQTILDVRFTDTDSLQQLEAADDGVALGVSLGGEKCLQIDAAVSSMALKPIPVQPLQKYKLTIRAAVESKDTIENNDRIGELSMKTHGRGFSGFAVTCLDQDGNKTGLKLRDTVLVDNSGAILSSKFHDSIHVFYSPPKVERIRLELKPRKNRLFIESVKLELENDEGTINCNPDFRYGELNLSGWRPDSDGGLYRRPDGKTILKSGVSAVSPIFIVNDHSAYSFFCKGSSYESKRGKTTLSFYDDRGIKKGFIHLFWADDMKGGATKKGVVPPPGTFQGQVEVSRAIFEELRVTKDD